MFLLSFTLCLGVDKIYILQKRSVITEVIVKIDASICLGNDALAAATRAAKSILELLSFT